MALNKQVFKTRALTAVIFVVIMLTGLLYNYWSFFLLFSIIHIGCWIEYQKIIGLIDGEYNRIHPLHKYSVIVLGFAFMLFCSSNESIKSIINLYSIGVYAMFISGIILLLSEMIFLKDFNAKMLWYSFLGLIYISLSWSLMMNIRSGNVLILTPITSSNTAFIIPIILIAAIWVNDTMAYIVGSFIGKTPLSKISPKKTWEGTIGGAILAITVVGYVANYYTKIGLPICIGIASIAAIIGTIGDLLESKLKRTANIKDSGSFMPGHGGFLDRFDSLLLATPFVWLFLWAYFLLN